MLDPIRARLPHGPRWSVIAGQRGLMWTHLGCNRADCLSTRWTIVEDRAGKPRKVGRPKRQDGSAGSESGAGRCAAAVHFDDPAAIFAEVQIDRQTAPVALPQGHFHR